MLFNYTMIPLTPLQKYTIAQIDAATQLPTVLCDLIAHYAQDFSMAQRSVVLTKNKKMIDVRLREAISEALISPNCETQIKREIVDNAIFGHYTPTLNDILNQIRRKGYFPNFDYTDLSGLNLSGLDLTGMSAVSAKFVKSTLRNVNLSDADLTGAWIQSCNLVSVNLTRTILYKATLCDSDLSGACLTRTDLNRTQLQRVKTGDTVFLEVMTDNAELQKILDLYAERDDQGQNRSTLNVWLFGADRIQKPPVARRVITMTRRADDFSFTDY